MDENWQGRTFNSAWYEQQGKGVGNVKLCAVCLSQVQRYKACKTGCVQMFNAPISTLIFYPVKSCWTKHRTTLFGTTLYGNAVFTLQIGAFNPDPKRKKSKKTPTIELLRVLALNLLNFLPFNRVQSNYQNPVPTFLLLLSQYSTTGSWKKKSKYSQQYTFSLG